jgi:hypothetical protein
MVLEQSVIKASTAGNRKNGGAISAWKSARLALDGCNITHNFAPYGGGGLSLADNSTLTVRSHTTFHSNMAGVAGGAMRLYSNTAPDEMLRLVRFINNTAPNAPDISWAL